MQVGRDKGIEGMGRVRGQGQQIQARDSGKGGTQVPVVAMSMWGMGTYQQQ